LTIQKKRRNARTFNDICCVVKRYAHINNIFNRLLALYFAVFIMNINYLPMAGGSALPVTSPGDIPGFKMNFMKFNKETRLKSIQPRLATKTNYRSLRRWLDYVMHMLKHRLIFNLPGRFRSSHFSPVQRSNRVFGRISIKNLWGNGGRWG
jgi:hypothetical protein